MMKGIAVLTVSLALLFGTALAAGNAEEGKRIPTREEIEEQYRWNLGDIYADTETWEADYAYVEANMEKIKDFRGKLGKSASNLEQCLLMSENLERKLDKLYIYAHMLKDQDTKNTESQALANRI
ncbi:MAG: hypothetical protein PHD63_01860, partial [Candidatus Marinimicrobia bacterium]|nr:hypothetical protein [Candidatus Neomarinimicrobiota bacterium]